MDPEQVVQAAMDAGAQYADIRVERSSDRRVELADREVRGFVAGEETGFNLRVLVDGSWGQASSNDLGRRSWRRALDSALGLARGVDDHEVELAEAPAARARVHDRPRQGQDDVDVDDILDLLRAMDDGAREFPEVRGVTATFSDSVLTKEVVTSDGSHVEWSQPRIMANLEFTAKDGSHLTGRSARVGGTTGFELFAQNDPVAKVRETARDAVRALGAPAAKGGKQMVVIDHDLAGVFAHEAVGHASEADLVAAGESCFRDRLGQQVGRAGLTIRDDPTIAGAFGSLPFDDDGVAARRKTLIEDGRLVGFLCDRQHAARFGLTPNGAARTQSFQHRPLVRMSNTFIDPGDQTREEVLDIKEGIFCRGSRGGQVDTARGTFLFNAADAWRIEDGEITTPIRDVSLTGTILETLHQIDAIGNDFLLGDPGFCGKGQWVPVADGGPTIRIRDCLVGGTA